MVFLGKIDRDVEVNQGGGGGITILPDDEYELEAYESDVVANSKGTGKNLNFKVEVVSGAHKGVWFFADITSVEHDSAAAQRIGQGQMRAMSLSAGVDWDTLQDSKQLERRPFFAFVTSETYHSRKHQKDMTKNVIKTFLYDGMPEETASQPPAEKAAPREAPRQEAPKADAAPARSWRTKAA